MTAEQHKAYTEACNAFGEALEKIFKTDAPMVRGQDVYVVNRSHNIKDTVRDWEILEFRHSHHNHIAFLWDEKRRVYTGNGYHTLDAMLCLGNTIHSVRRLSDNTIWTVGCDHKAHIEHKISSFGVEDGVMYVNPGTLGKMALEYLKKPDLVLTTEDGVECYNSLDTLLWINEGVIVSSPASYILKQGGKAYSTREAAEKAYECWLLSQPVLSGYDAFKWQDGANLSDLIKDKIAKR